MVLPSMIYRGIAALYLGMIVISGCFTFTLSYSFPFMLGIVIDHAVRAVGFPCGVLATVKKKLFGAAS